MYDPSSRAVSSITPEPTAGSKRLTPDCRPSDYGVCEPGNQSKVRALYVQVACFEAGSPREPDKAPRVLGSTVADYSLLSPSGWWSAPTRDETTSQASRYFQTMSYQIRERFGGEPTSERRTEAWQRL